jgi:hypothetical protein
MDRHDNLKSYCRMLGHGVPFKYCRTTAQGVPCRKILDCWFESIPIREYMEAHYSPEELERILKAPENKVSSLLDLIEQARRRGDGSRMPDES